MTDASAAPSAETPFGQHARLAELVNGLRLQRYALFVAGLLYEHADGGLHRATAVADRDGNVLAWDAGEPFHLGGRVPASRLFDDADLTGRPEGTLLRALADRNQEFFAHEVAALTEGRHSVNEVAIRILRQWLRPEHPPAAVLRAEVLGVYPIEVTDGLLDTLRELANQPDRGFLVEQVLQTISP
jgi:hypothetical protein